jgi:hypothetical protein
VSIAPATIPADGRSKATVTVKVTGVHGEGIAAQDMALESSGPVSVGPLTDDGDGTYTATITASHTAKPATITASDLSAAPASTATARLVQGPPKITVSVKPGKLQANGQSTAKVTVRLAGVQGEPVNGEQVTVTTTGPATAGLVANSGSGVYTTELTALRAAGAVKVVATDDSVDPQVSASAKLSVTGVTKAKSKKGKGKKGKSKKGKSKKGKKGKKG